MESYEDEGFPKGPASGGPGSAALIALAILAFAVLAGFAVWGW